MYIDPITMQNFQFTMPISCDNNPEVIIALDPDSDHNYGLALKPVIQATLTRFKPERIQSAVSPSTFTAQEAGKYSNAQITNFRNRVLFKKTF